MQQQNVSIATIESPEFVNVTSVSPLISKCEIKVFYLGKNRNHSLITKEVAIKLAGTLPGTPIVGYYKKEKEDFRDHGQAITVDGDGIKFKCLTKPYGFVPTDTKIWFKNFRELDEKGNPIIRTYLMCEGYLWTEQYKEAMKIAEEGRPQSMELDEETLKGNWTKDYQTSVDFFIINDAVISKLCALGEDVEPCFEGASITAPDISSEFSLETKDFMNTLFTMMKELKEYYNLSSKEQGGEMMEKEQDVIVQEESTEKVDENFSIESDTKEQEIIAENQNNVKEFKKNDEEEEKSAEQDDKEEVEDSKEDKQESEEEEDKKKVTKNTLVEESAAAAEEVSSNETTISAVEYQAMVDKYSALEIKFNELNTKYSSLVEQNNSLLEFKKNIEDKEKDALIEKFYMLSEEDKKEVIENKSKFSLDDIEAKLSVICVRKNICFDHEEKVTEKEPAITFNLNAEDNLPAWLKAVEVYNNRNN